MKSFEEAKEELKQYINENYEQYPYAVAYVACSDDDELILKSEKFLDQEIIGDSVHISSSWLGNVKEFRCYYRVKMSRIPFRVYIIRYNRDDEWVPYINKTLKITAKYVDRPLNSLDELDELPTYLDLDEPEDEDE